MADCVEILFTTDSNGAQSTCSAWDPKTGTNLMAYKGGGAANQRGLSFIKSEFVVSANSTKPLIHVWPVNSQEQITAARFVAPGKPNAVAVSPDGNYLVAGIQETMYVWEICSGKMLNSLSKHYQSITTIKFTDDGSHVITAGQDGTVLVWNLTKIVGQNDSSLLPLYTFNDHALPVTDLHVGTGGIRAFLCSVSTDRTLRMYDLSSGTLLLNLVFNEPLTCATMNLLETAIYVGTAQGAIYEVFLTAPPRTKEYHLTKEDYSNKFLGHKNGVTCLSLSLDGETLVSGGQDENVYLWHIPSKQLLRTLPHKGAITNVLCVLGTRNMFNPEVKYSLIATNLSRMKDATAASDDSAIVEILVNDPADDAAYYSNGGKETVCGATNMPSVGDSSQEVERLRAEVKLLRGKNQQLFEFCAKKILKTKQ